MPNLRQINVFISSPSDVIAERAAVARVVARLDDVWKAHVRLNAVLWESGHYEAAQGFQESIGEMADFDIVVGLLWKRVGSPLRRDRFRRPDGSGYESGTVFELETAIAHSEADGKPRVFLFRKAVPVTFSAEHVEEERTQYEALSRWWDRTVRDEEGHFVRGYEEFATADALEHSIEDILESYLREHDLIPAGAAWTIETRGSPYPGLLAYNSAYSDVFFGRSLATAAAMDDLLAAAGRDSPVLFVVGPSGSGKSSLARAGLAPRIDGGQIRGVDFWRRLLIEPAQDPVLEFARALFQERGLPELRSGPNPTPESFAALCRQSAEAAVGAIRWGLERAVAGEGAGPRGRAEGAGDDQRRAGRLLIVLDQLETFLDSPDAAPVSALIRALVEGETAWVIATLRSDRYADLQQDADLMALKRRGAMFDLPPPGPSEIADIIKGPARAAQLVFEERDGQSLANLINTDVRGADALPLLQMTLARLFEARDGMTLTWAAYEEMGGIEGAIASHAEAVFGTVSPAGQAALDGLLRALVADIEEDGALTLRTADWTTIAGDPAARELIEKLTEGRLLVNADGTIRIAHEALLRRWRRATASPALQPEAIRLRRQIEPVFQVWRRTGLDIDLLQPGTTTIAAAEALVRDHAGVFPPEIEDYVRQSIAAAEAQAHREREEAEAAARRARRRAWLATAAAFAFAGLAVLAFVIYHKAEENLGLAMLTKAEAYLGTEKPTRALVMAGAAAGAGLLPAGLEAALFGGGLAEEDIRARTIAGIAGPASAAPLRTLMLPQTALAVAFDPTGDRFAAAGLDGEIRIHRTDDGDEVIRLRGHEGSVEYLQYSADGRYLASGGSDRTVRLWDLAKRQVRTLCEHSQVVTEVAIDPKGRFLASTSNDGRLIVRDLASLATVLDFPRGGEGGRPGAWALALDFSRDGALLASTDEDGNLFIHDTATWRTRRIETGQPDLISVAFSADAARVATAGIDGSLDIWRTADGAHLHEIHEHRNKLWKVLFTPAGDRLAVASWDGTVRLWDADTYRYAGTIDGSDHWVTAVAFSPDSTMLLTADWAGAVHLWRARDIRPMFLTVRDNDRETITGAYSPDGSRFVTGSRDRQARLYRVTETGDIRPVCRVGHEDWVDTVDFSGDGSKVVSSGTADRRAGNLIRVWDAADCRMIRTVDVGRADVRRAVFDPTRDRIAWSTRSGEIWLAELKDGAAPVRFPESHGGDIYALEFSPDGRLLASGGADSLIRIWDPDTRTARPALRGHQSTIYAVKFSPDGRLLASASYDENILLWGVADGGGPVGSLFVRGRPSGPIHFDRKGEILAIGSDARYVSMWSLKDRSKIFQLDALVGVRGLFGIHSTRGDLAFDGESGLVRILPNGLGLQLHEPPPNARLKGSDVFFAPVAGTAPAAAPAAEIRAPDRACGG